MERRERKNAVTVLAPAKLNLALDVVGLLPNGYHALDMTMQTITLYERVMLRRSAGLSLRLPGSLVQPNDKNTAIKAALEAFEQSGLDMAQEDALRFGVNIGSGIGSLQTIEEEYRKGQKRGFDRISPLFVPMAIVNMAAGSVAIRLGFKGSCTCCVTACASGTNSIGEAFHAKIGRAHV